MLLRIHNMHRPALEQVLISLATAGEASYLAMATTSTTSTTTSAEGLPTSPGVGGGGSAGAGAGVLDSPIVHGRPRNVGDIMYAKYQEFWINIGSEVSLSTNVWITFICYFQTKYCCCATLC